METDEWIYRFARDHVDFDRELAVLSLLADRLPVRIPRVAWVGRRSRFAAYRKIVGQPLERDRYRAAAVPGSSRWRIRWPNIWPPYTRH